MSAFAAALNMLSGFLTCLMRTIHVGEMHDDRSQNRGAGHGGDTGQRNGPRRRSPSWPSQGPIAELSSTSLRRAAITRMNSRISYQRAPRPACQRKEVSRSTFHQPLGAACRPAVCDSARTRAFTVKVSVGGSTIIGLPECRCSGCRLWAQPSGQQVDAPCSMGLAPDPHSRRGCLRRVKPARHCPPMHCCFVPTRPHRTHRGGQRRRRRPRTSGSQRPPGFGL